jgi:hypothetical protein
MIRMSPDARRAPDEVLSIPRCGALLRAKRDQVKSGGEAAALPSNGRIRLGVCGL